MYLLEDTMVEGVEGLEVHAYIYILKIYIYIAVS